MGTHALWPDVATSSTACCSIAPLIAFWKRFRKSEACAWTCRGCEGVRSLLAAAGTAAGVACEVAAGGVWGLERGVIAASTSSGGSRP